jgi:hypothetical protein
VGLIVAGQFLDGELRIGEEPWQLPAKLDVTRALAELPGSVDPTAEGVDAQPATRDPAGRERSRA